MDIENCAPTTPRSDKQFNLGSQDHLKIPDKVTQIYDNNNEHSNHLRFFESNAVSKSLIHSLTTPPQKNERLMLSHDNRSKIILRNRFSNINPLLCTTSTHENLEISNTQQQKTPKNGVIVNLQIQESNSNSLLTTPILNQSQNLDSTKRLTAVK